VGIRWGIEGVAAGQVALAVLFVVIDVVVVARVLGFGGGDTLRAIWPTLVATAVMSGVAVLVDRGVAPDGLLGMLGVIIVAAAAFVATLAVVSAETIRSARKVVRSAMSKA
jgi:hypothetical protein